MQKPSPTRNKIETTNAPDELFFWIRDQLQPILDEMKFGKIEIQVVDGLVGTITVSHNYKLEQKIDTEGNTTIDCG